MFSKILIANRGEIAVRIIRACNEMGIRTVAVYSEADAQALHVNLADESYCIGPALLKDSYLNMTAIIDVAIATGCQAIHPGYGLLSENPRFAELCEKCNIKFIGPHWSVIARMGDKDEARRTMKAAGVPVVPGLDEITDVAAAKKFAAEIGYPVIVKAAAGGGGRGIRIVWKEEDFETAVQTASAEAQSAFGNGKVYLEKYLTDVKHVEMQIVADEQGNVVCLGERDCSMQRKKPKAHRGEPLRRLKAGDARRDDALRRPRGKDGRLHQPRHHRVSARQAGQVLFHGDEHPPAGRAPRHRIRHGIGIDVVKWQIRIAAGIEFIYKQEDIRLRGCAIECRINSEDARNNFRPSCGQIRFMHIPGGPWVRFDTAIYQDYVIPPYYDSMIGKLIVYARERTEAIRKMQAALCELVIDGVHTNAELSGDILAQPEFKDGTYCTNFLEKFLKDYR